MTLRPALQPLGFVGGEDDLAGGGTRRGRQAGGDDFALRRGSMVGCSSWSSEAGIDARDRFAPR
jgi:hypothetical protein